jgi:hypothetical protein
MGGIGVDRLLPVYEHISGMVLEEEIIQSLPSLGNAGNT